LPVQNRISKELNKTIHKYYAYEVIAVSIFMILMCDNFFKSRNYENLFIIIISFLAVLYLLLKIYLMKKDLKFQTFTETTGIIEKKYSKIITPHSSRLFFKVNNIDFEVSMENYIKYSEGDRIKITTADKSNEILIIEKF